MNRVKHTSRGWLALTLVTALAASGCAATGGQNGADADYRAVLEDSYRADRPGATVIVSRDGEVLYHDAIGMADLEMDVPLATDHILRLASVSKQYTAAAILNLVAEDRIALDDPLSEFLPDYPQGDVTVHQLLNHTSGIKSYTSIEGYMGDERIRRHLDTEELVSVFRDREPDFEPGSNWAYNNSGYVLLGAIIESVTGQAWNDYIREALLVPAGIEHTDYYPQETIIPGRVEGYHAGDEVTNAPWLSMTQPHAAGALSATAADVDRWQQTLHGGELLPETLYQRMITPEGAAAESDYGYGIARTDIRGHAALQHGGGIHGFNTHALWIPSEKLSVVVLSNYAGHEPRPAVTARRLAARTLGESYPVDEPTIDLSATDPEALVGTYRIDEDTTRTLELKDGELVSRRGEGRPFVVKPVSRYRFVFPNSLTYFDVVRNEAGEVTALEFHQEGEAEIERAEKISDTVEREEAVSLSQEAKERLTGQYEIQPGFVLAIRIEDDELVGQATGQGSFPLTAYAEDRLGNPDHGIRLTFDLPETGPATALTLHQAGQAIPAERIND